MRFVIFAFALLLQFATAHAQERQWRLDASATDAFLVFGVADTDDAGLSFWCKIGSGTISIFTPFNRDLIKKDQQAAVQLMIDTNTFNIKMKARMDMNSKTGSLEGPVSVKGTVMQAVAKASTFSLTAFGHRQSYPLIDADVDGLLRTCSGEVLN